MQQNAEKLEKELGNLVNEWQLHPELFALDALGVTPTTQQFEAFKAIGELVRAKMKYGQGKKLTPEENELKDKVGLSIMSGKGTGKDAFASWVVLWFHCCFKNSKIPVTGPSRDQLRDVFMAETCKWTDRIDEQGNPCFIFKDQVKTQADKIYSVDPKNPDKAGKSWFVRLRTAPKVSGDDVQSKNLDGLHEDFMMVVVDEADGVQAPVITSLETTLTKPVNFMLMIFNPTKNYGYAYETHYGDRAKFWIPLHWDSRDSENVDEIKTRQIRETYGEGSVEYRVNVLGLPPEQTPDDLIPRSWLDHAKDRSKEEVDPPVDALRIMGVDPSRQGKDPCGVIIRDSFHIQDLQEIHDTKDTTILADHLAEIFLDWDCDMMYIDTIGIGGPLYDDLVRRFPGKVRSVDVSLASPDRKKRFKRLRDDLWWKVREAFQNNIVTIPHNHRLTKKFINELTVMRRDRTDEEGAGQIKIEGKSKMKTRGLKSPNLGEAFMVTLAAKDAVYARPKGKEKPRDKYRDSRQRRREKAFSHNWMVA